jgi:hypothetical protein
MLNKYFVKSGREPFKKCKSMNKAGWARFKKVRKSKEFKALSKKPKGRT